MKKTKNVQRELIRKARTQKRKGATGTTVKAHRKTITPMKLQKTNTKLEMTEDQKNTLALFK